MNVVALTTTLRASIHREPATAAKAKAWATRSSELAESAKALHPGHPDLAIESANLAARMTELAKDLRGLAAAQSGTDESAKLTAHKRVIGTSEQVEVITREPAARCAGDTRNLRPVAGRLAASKILPVVQAGFPRYRACYDEGLQRNPTLQGRVSVHFVIALDGKVSEAHDATSEPIPSGAIAPPGASSVPPIADQKVADCVVSRVRDLVFPKPDGGAVVVVYPVHFTATAE